MRKLTLMLATVAVGLALECAHLLKQIEVERGRTRAETDRRQELETRVQQIEREQLAARKASGFDAVRAGSPSEDPPTQPAPPARDVAPDGKETSGSKMTRDDQGAQLLKMLEDPAGRELLHAQAIAALRTENPDLAHELGLTTDEYDRLLALLAEQSLQRMDLVEGVDLVSASRTDELEELVRNQKQDVAYLLGDEKARQYEEYMASQPVRAHIRRLRARLSEDNALRDDQSARLAIVLQNEGARFAKELREQYAGENVTYSMGGWYGGEFMASNTRGTSAEEQILAQMEDYDRRIVRSAASVLSASQLEVFTHLLDESLALQRVQLRMEADTPGE